VSVARFVADQRTMHRVPHTVTCAILGISISWFYKWIGRGPSERQRRRAALDARVRAVQGLPGHLRLAPHPRRPTRGRRDGECEHRRGLDAPAGLAGPQTLAAPGIDPPRLVGAEVSRPAAPGLHRPGAEREVVRRHHRDPHRRRQALLGLGAGPAFAPAAGQSDLGSPRRRPGLRYDQDGRGGTRRTRSHRPGHLPHRSRTYLHRNGFHYAVPKARGVAIDGQGRFDNAAAEAFFSTLEHEVLSRHHFTTKAHARQVVVPWCQDFYNTRRRHSSAALLSPIQYERLTADQPAAA
jgi:putative transposase